MTWEECYDRYRKEYNDCLKEVKNYDAKDILDAAHNLFAETCSDPAAIVGYYTHWYGKNAYKQWKENIKHKKQTELMEQVNKIFEEIKM